MKPPPMAVDHARREVAPHRMQFVGADVVFKAREGGVRRERVAVDGVAPEQELVDGIVSQAIGVVRIRMATGEPVDALGQQIAKRVPHLPRVPIIDEAAGKAIDQAVARFCGLEQDRAAIRARVGLIERRH